MTNEELLVLLTGMLITGVTVLAITLGRPVRLNLWKVTLTVGRYRRK